MLRKLHLRISKLEPTKVPGRHIKIGGMEVPFGNLKFWRWHLGLVWMDCLVRDGWKLQKPPKWLEVPNPPNQKGFFFRRPKCSKFHPLSSSPSIELNFFCLEVGCNLHNLGVDLTVFLGLRQTELLLLLSPLAVGQTPWESHDVWASCAQWR